MPTSVFYLEETFIFEWRGSKNEYQKDMCLKEIGLYVQNMMTILSILVNIIGGEPIWPLNEHNNPYFDNE